jgi:hypothetical protein
MMPKKILIAVLIALVMWFFSSYMIPSFLLKAKWLKGLELKNEENLNIVPAGKFKTAGVDQNYLQSLRSQSLGTLSFAIPVEYLLHNSSRDNFLVFRADARNVLMVTKSDISTLNSRFSKITGRFPQAGMNNTYEFMKKALYVRSDQFLMSRVDVVLLVCKATLLSSQKEISKIYEYETKYFKGFMMISQLKDKQVKTFEMFDDKGNWISILFINDTLSQVEIDSILSTFIVKEDQG